MRKGLSVGNRRGSALLMRRAMICRACTSKTKIWDLMRSFKISYLMMMMIVEEEAMIEIIALFSSITLKN